jgi:hypothetical protein
MLRLYTFISLKYASCKSRENKADYYRLILTANMVMEVTKVVTNERRFSTKVPVIFVQFQLDCDLLDRFDTVLQYRRAWGSVVVKALRY